ncbi:hypothetical protein LTR05_002505 [Lithohypha guttulata]|uniref:Calcineurin-like phosphoesterase domain-containing protein n=1 Tax=Lithohypha guttulata TaxID=1690604 RepID=A0AAN7Y7S3_9EURO|nr:hypothetical protein LTR05_002505 [Lithohypha guttulata]
MDVDRGARQYKNVYLTTARVEVPRMKQLRDLVEESKMQRWAVVILILVLVALAYRQTIVTTYIDHDRAIDEANHKGHAPALIQVETLDPRHLPRTSKTTPDHAAAGKRLIFVGDIHGCMEELQALLSKVNYKQDTDHIIALGDMINKGPDSKGVVNFLMDQGASAVRGNHEDSVLLAANNLPPIPPDPPSLANTAIEDSPKIKLARTFTQSQIHWLNTCPVILRVGDLDHHGEIVAVHGGLVPGIRLEKQNPNSVMNMRTINPNSRKPSAEHVLKGSIPWAEYWDKTQKSLLHRKFFFGRKKKPTTVVFGHDARKRLQILTYAKGLDTSCVKGNQLTAWVVSDFGKDTIVQVQCKGYV